MSARGENLMDINEEFGFLESTLRDLGLYEDGMDLEEMRIIRDAVNESIEESSQIFEDELQAALKESEEMINENLLRSLEDSSLQSTSAENSNIVFNAKSSTPPSSPDHPFTMDVLAEIHTQWRNDSIDAGNFEIVPNTDEHKTAGGILKDMKPKKLARAERKADDIFSVLDVSDEKL